MSMKASALWPCASDFAAGDFWWGGTRAAMQMTLVLWPVAYLQARRAAAARAMNERLREVAAAYAVRRPMLPPSPPARLSAMREAV